MQSKLNEDDADHWAYVKTKSLLLIYHNLSKKHCIRFMLGALEHFCKERSQRRRYLNDLIVIQYCVRVVSDDALGSAGDLSGCYHGQGGYMIITHNRALSCT